jgi:hypothetical protein
MIGREKEQAENKERRGAIVIREIVLCISDIETIQSLHMMSLPRKRRFRLLIRAHVSDLENCF